MPEIVLGAGSIAWIAAILSLTVGLIVKDFVTSFVSGFAFWIDPAFKEGDHVFIDGEEAVIVKCGLRRTVFGIRNGRGYTWRYVWNEQIKSINIEKVIIPKKRKDIDDLNNSGDGND